MLAEAAPPVALAEALEEWASGYSKDHAHNGRGNADERRIIDLCATHPRPELDCTLYRGQGIPDGLAARLLNGSADRIEHSKRLFSSWTKDIEVARQFLVDATECNESAVLIGIHASRLDLLVDLTEFDVTGEAEVLALAGPIIVSPENILEAWEYNPHGEYEGCVQIHGPGQQIGPALGP